MRVFITGAGGFAGRYLVAELMAAGHTPFGFGTESPRDADLCPFIKGDILNPESLLEAVRQVRPEAGVHLAALASPPDGATKAALMASVNIQGALHVLEAFRREAPQARLLVVSSARVYGSGRPGVRLTEDDPLNPDSLYAVTKEAADRLTLQYARDFTLPFMVARPHNHTGPGQPEDLIVGSFVAQFRRMMKGDLPPVLKTGNQDSARDFLDVRDVVRAYRLLLEKATPGKAYNIAANRPVTIRELIATLSRLAGVEPETRIDPARYRPVDFSALLDTTRLEEATHWRPRLALEQTLRDMLNA